MEVRGEVEAEEIPLTLPLSPASGGEGMMYCNGNYYN
jgi:hypothetical protein